MKILIGCEESGTVTEQFMKMGHTVFSCDLLPCSHKDIRLHEVHMIEDVFKAFEMIEPDMCIFFPPCTHLSGAGAPSWKIKQADGRQDKAINFVLELATLPCSKIAIENPTGILSTKWRKPDQIINPYQFGDPFKKRTCLWLKGLPLLVPTNIVEPKYHYTSNSTRGGLLKDGTRKKSELPIRKAWDNSCERSKSFEGIAKAMAQQWG